jgi:hypothetical protein
LLPISRKGNFIHYGYRTCGKLDCVNPDHVTQNIKKGKTLSGAKPPRLYNKKPDMTGEQLHRIAKPLFRGTEPAQCQVAYCKNKHRAINLCAKHHHFYLKWRKAQGLPRMRQDFTDVVYAVQPAKGNTLRSINRHCHVDNCTRAYQARGLCKMHYGRWLRLGSPMIVS